MTTMAGITLALLLLGVRCLTTLDMMADVGVDTSLAAHDDQNDAVNKIFIVPADPR